MKHFKPLLAALVLSTLPAVQAAPVVDQSFVSNAGEIGAVIGVLPGFFDLKVFQGFTVGMSGVLTRVDFALETDGSPTANLMVEIVSAADLLGAALASVSVAPSAVGATSSLVAFDFSAASLAVNVGDQLAIRLSSAQDFEGNSNQYVARGARNGGYAGGVGVHWFSTSGFQQNPIWDFDFRTYVDTARATVPEPSGLALVAAALAALALTRRRTAR